MRKLLPKMEKIADMKTNTSITNESNRYPYTRTQKDFLAKAEEICRRKGRFCCADFPELSNGNFRQLVHRIRNCLELDFRSNPCFYRLKGMSPEDIKTVTEKPTGDRMIDILQRLREQPPKIHDIKVKFNYPLHKKLERAGAVPDPTNKGIRFTALRMGNDFTIKIMVYPNTVQIDLGCTNNPLVYDISGAVKLTSFLGRLYQELYVFAHYDAYLPQIGKWIVTHYHFGKDGSETYSGQLYHLTYENVATGLIRFYSKPMSDGRIVSRIEQIQRPNNTLDQEIDNMIRHETAVEHMIEVQEGARNDPS